MSRILFCWCLLLLPGIEIRMAPFEGVYKESNNQRPC